MFSGYSLSKKENTKKKKKQEDLTVYKLNKVMIMVVDSPFIFNILYTIHTTYKYIRRGLIKIKRKGHHTHIIIY